MAIFTKSQFESIAKSRTGLADFKAVNMFESRKFSKSSSTTSIFLSHSHVDQVVVAQAKGFFETLGISIYIDWADETMPEKTNGVTASRIKSKILSNDKFILLATNAAVSSKWCNWEVGIGDVYKLNSDKICILPLADNNATWLGNEYLQIYPRVEPVENYSNIFRVIYPDGKVDWLHEWLKK